MDGRTDLLAVVPLPPPLNAFAAIVGSAGVVVAGLNWWARFTGKEVSVAAAARIHRGVKCTGPPLFACLDHLFPISVYSGTPSRLSMIQPEGK